MSMQSNMTCCGFLSFVSGEDVTIADEIMVLDSIVLPHKNLSYSYKHEIIL